MKPWPVRISTVGLMVDANTSAPTIQHSATDDTPPPSTTCLPRQHSHSDLVAPDAPTNSRHALLGAAPGPSRPMFQRSHTQPKPQQSHRLTTDGIGNRLKSYVKTDVIYGKVKSLLPDGADPSNPLSLLSPFRFHRMSGIGSGSLRPHHLHAIILIFITVLALLRALSLQCWGYRVWILAHHRLHRSTLPLRHNFHLITSLAATSILISILTSSG